jgi:hypothetical protein
MKRLVAGMALTATSIVATIGLAAPAQAAAYVHHGTYGWGDQCLGVGYYGKTNNQWTSYYCTTIVPSSWNGPGRYELWVA